MLLVSFYYLIRPQQQRLRDREAEGLGGLEIDHQLELGGRRLARDWGGGSAGSRTIFLAFNRLKAVTTIVEMPAASSAASLPTRRIVASSKLSNILARRWCGRRP